MSAAGEPWPAVEASLAFVLRPEPTLRRDWPELARLLDGLAMARHACPAPDHPEHVADDGGPDPARQGYDSLRKEIGPRFPDFGYYRVVAPLVEGALDMQDTPGVGDAIDDLCDIAGDLQEAKWFRAQHGDAVGGALFAWGYDRHWGQHLRELQGYLHCRLRE